MTDPIDSQDSGAPANGETAPGPQPLAPRRRRFRLRRNRTAFDRASVTGPDVATELFGAKPGFTPVARRPRGIYLLPNAFTTGNLFAGFYAIVMAMNDQFAAAAIAIFLAMFLDSLDGRVARMTNTQSAFGEQYDSLADVISFGAAPALVMYSWALKGMGKWGWLAAFVYVAGAALRLARFNTNIHVVDKRFFQGLPSPAAAALIAGLVWIATDLREARWISSSGADLGWLAWITTVYAGVTMVSNSPFYSFKDINFKRSVPFIFLILLVLGLVLISSDPPLVLFSLFVVYGLSGHALALWRWSRGVPALWKAVGRADVESARAPLDSDDDAPPDSSRARPGAGVEPDGAGRVDGAQSGRDNHAAVILV